MKKKNLTKEQLKERKEKFNKWCKRLLIISLAVNVFFVICTIVGSCGTKSKSTSAATDNNNLIAKTYRNKNNAVTGSDIFNGNSSAVGYNILSLVNTLGSERIDRSITFVYGQETTLIADATIRSGTSCYLSVNVHSPIIQNDYVYFENYLAPNYDTPRYRIQWRYLNNGGWTLTSGGSIAVEEDLYLFTNRAINDNAKYFDDVFNTIDYRDLNMPFDWNLSALWSTDFYIGGSEADQTLTIATDFVAYVNGNVYDTLQVSLIGGGAVNVVKSDGSVVDLTGNRIIYYVWLKNTSANKMLNIMSVDYQLINHDNSTTHAIVEKSLHFTNSNFQNIRLFDYNLKNNASIGEYNSQYTIYDVFFLNNVSSSGSTGQIGDVFGMFTTAFNGLTGLFSISILPGITIGVLLFLPLIGIIVFAIIRVIKK